MTKQQPPKERATGSTETFTYILLLLAAKEALKSAKEKEEGSFYTSLHSIVFTAFALESFLNHLGRRLFPTEPKFKWKRPDDKLKAVCAKLGFTPNMGISPYQSFGRAFATRNLAAHSETVVQPFDRMVDADDAMPRPERSPLELQCTLAIAERLFKDAKKIVEDLHERAGLPFKPLLIATHTSWVQS